MAEVSISSLPAATDVAGAQVPVLQGGATRRASVNLLGGASSYVAVAGQRSRTDAQRWGDLWSLQDYVVADAETDVAAGINSTFTAAVAANKAVRMPAGIYRTNSQVVFPPGLKLLCEPGAVLLKAWGGSASKRANAAVRNQNAPLDSALIVDNSPWSPSTTDDDIYIHGLRIRHSSDSAIGCGFYMMGTRRLRLIECVVEQSRNDWAFAVGGDDMIAERPEVLANTGIFADGFHVLHGTRGQILSPRINSGDDCIAFGTNWDLAISDWQVLGGRGSSTHGHVVTLYQYRVGVTASQAPPISKIRGILVDGICGQFGITRNGLLISNATVCRYTLTAGSTTTGTLPSTASPVNNFYRGARVTIVSGTGTANQQRYITAYNGTTKVFTVSEAFSVAPASGTVVDIEGALLEDITFRNMDLTGSTKAVHTGILPVGVRLSNIRNLYLENMKIRSCIRTPIELENVVGDCIVSGCATEDPLTDDDTWPPTGTVDGVSLSPVPASQVYAMSVRNCERPQVIGGSYARTKNYAILNHNSRLALIGTDIHQIEGGFSGVVNTTDLGRSARTTTVGLRPSEMPGATATRALRNSGSNVHVGTFAADLSGIDGLTFDDIVPATQVVGDNLMALGGTSKTTTGYEPTVAEHYGGEFDNFGTVVTLTVFPQAARVGMFMTIRRIANVAVRFDPNGTNTVGAGGAGKYLQLDTTGGYVRLRCYAANAWTIIESSGTISYEP